MGVERVDYSSDEEFNAAREEEERWWHTQEDEEAWENGEPPNIVPCFICDGEAYESGPNPEDNLCDQCAILSQAEKMVILFNRKKKKQNEVNK